MMKMILFFVALALVGVVFAQDRRPPSREPASSHSARSSESVTDRPTMGILDARFVGHADDAVLRDLFTSAVRGKVVKLVADSVDVIEGSKLDRLIQVNASSCSNASCLAQFAKKAGLDYLLETKLTFHKGKWTASLKLASARSENLLDEEQETYTSDDAAQTGLPVLASQVVKSLMRSGNASEAVSPGTVAEDVPLAPPPAGAVKVIVKFGSSPEGAAVSVDGNFLCTTPDGKSIGKSVVQGDHWISMGKDGYRQKKERVSVTRNGQELSWTLTPIQTRLNLDAVDDRTSGDLVADVYVDGVKVGQTPFDGLVPVAAQKIEVSPEGFARQTVSVSLEEGKTAQATAHFRSVEKPKVPSGMVSIPAGCFMMGEFTYSGSDESPHRVCLDAFSMDKYDVTQGAYRAATGKNPSFFSNCGDNCPMELVNWSEAKAYCESQGKRLPTEAEWEYAARAGTTTRYYWGNDTSEAGRYAWYAGNSGNTTHPVGQKEPNAWGLYDMAGNVWQWTADWYAKDYYGSYPERNPKGPSSGSARVYRGGNWGDGPAYLRSAYRDDRVPDGHSRDLGFRCVSP